VIANRKFQPSGIRVRLGVSGTRKVTGTGSISPTRRCPTFGTFRLLLSHVPSHFRTVTRTLFPFCHSSTTTATTTTASLSIGHREHGEHGTPYPCTSTSSTTASHGIGYREHILVQVWCLLACMPEFCISGRRSRMAMEDMEQDVGGQW
jgi:hypothetical protein